MAKHGNLPKKYMEKATGNPRPRTVVTNGSDAAGREGSLQGSKSGHIYAVSAYTKGLSCVGSKHNLCLFSAWRPDAQSHYLRAVTMNCQMILYKQPPSRPGVTASSVAASLRHSSQCLCSDRTAHTTFPCDGFISRALCSLQKCPCED